MEHWFIVVALVVLYMLPSIIAYRRGHASRHAIALVNALSAWTLIGWLICLIWSIANKGQSQTVVVNLNGSQQ